MVSASALPRVRSSSHPKPQPCPCPSPDLLELVRRWLMQWDCHIFQDIWTLWWGLSGKWALVDLAGHGQTLRSASVRCEVLGALLRNFLVVSFSAWALGSREGWGTKSQLFPSSIPGEISATGFRSCVIILKNQIPFLALGRILIVSYSTEEPNVEKTSSVGEFCFLYSVPMNELSLWWRREAEALWRACLLALIIFY